MRTLNVSLDIRHTSALDAALKAALSGKVIGVSTYGPGRPITIWLDDSATPDDEITAANIAAGAHDPVFVTVNKTRIQADDTETITITVSAPKPGAAPVILQVNGEDWGPFALTNGVGSDTLTAQDAGLITITVKNPANRSTDLLVIEAV